VGFSLGQWGLRADPWPEGQEAKPPKAKALVVFGRSMKAANLPTFLKFENAKK